MTNIIVAFPKQDTARNIKKILMQNGHHVDAVCTTGAQALQNANELDGGILVCGERDVENLVCLSTPLKINELLQTVEMMEYMITRRRKKARQKPKERSEEEMNLISGAKALLMERNNLTEEEAHRYMQKRSMDNGTGLTETAQMILSLLT